VAYHGVAPLSIRDPFVSGNKQPQGSDLLLAESPEHPTESMLPGKKPTAAAKEATFLRNVLLLRLSGMGLFVFHLQLPGPRNSIVSQIRGCISGSVQEEISISCLSFDEGSGVNPSNLCFPGRSPEIRAELNKKKSI
jgi:hypothetical protein